MWTAVVGVGAGHKVGGGGGMKGKGGKRVGGTRVPWERSTRTNSQWGIRFATSPIVPHEARGNRLLPSPLCQPTAPADGLPHSRHQPLAAKADNRQRLHAAAGAAAARRGPWGGAMPRVSVAHTWQCHGGTERVARSARAQMLSATSPRAHRDRGGPGALVHKGTGSCGMGSRKGEPAHRFPCTTGSVTSR